MTAKEIARALGGQRVGIVWMACCPAHDDRNPSLSIRDSDHDKVLVYRGRRAWREANVDAWVETKLSSASRGQ
jgi:hypothetical protein